METLTQLIFILTFLAISQALQCPNSKVPIHIAHEKLCSKFYSCYNDNIRELQCPKGLYFDESLSVCKNANEVNCRNKIKDDNNADVDEVAQSACVGKIDENIPNPQDCSSFYRCTNGVAVIEHCPANLYFNMKISACDWYYNVDCCEHKRTD